MRVVVFGATGRIGSRVADELLRRGHQVTGVVRRRRGGSGLRTPLTLVTADIGDTESVAQAVRGHDAVVSAIGPARGESPEVVVRAARSVLEGLRRARVGRLIVVGGAGSLEVPSGGHLLDTPGFPPEWRPVALAHRAALEVYRNETEIEWTYLSPAASIVSGVRTGRYRTGSDRLLTDPHGVSAISAEDLAVAIVDELETPRHLRRRFTVAAA